MTKIVLFPTPITLSESVLWYIKRKRKKKKKERKKERKKRLILFKNIYIQKIHVYSRTKRVKLKVPVNIQDNSSRIGAIV